MPKMESFPYWFLRKRMQREMREALQGWRCDRTDFSRGILHGLKITSFVIRQIRAQRLQEFDIKRRVAKQRSVFF